MRIRPNHHQTPRGLESGFGLVEVMIVVCVITILACMAVPFLGSARESATESLCIANLEQIERAKEVWATDQRKTGDAIPAGMDLLRYFQGEKLPICPEGGLYQIGSVYTPCTCTLGGEEHTLESKKDKKDKKPHKPKD